MQHFVAFSEYINFIRLWKILKNVNKLFVLHIMWLDQNKSILHIASENKTLYQSIHKIMQVEVTKIQEWSAPIWLATKGNLISESLSLWLKSPRKNQITILSIFSLSRLIALRVVMWHLYFKIWAKVKKNMRLSHL